MPDNPRTELELLRDGSIVRVIRVRTGPVTIGRDLSNTVSLTDEDVSTNHAVIAVVADGLRIRDLRSTNGTFVNGARVTSESPLADGDLVRIGEGCTLRIRQVAPGSGAALAVADLTAGTVHRIDGDRLLIGSGSACQIGLPDGPRFAASISLGTGDVWLDAEESGGGRSIAVGDTFEVGGHSFRLEALDRVAPKTTLGGPDSDAAPYALTVALDAPGGPVARIDDPTTGATHTVGAENRATLLYVLGRRRKEEIDRGDPEVMAGWIDDEDVLVVVWGRSAIRNATSNWSVLLHRLRRELDEAGFDPSILEKRRGAVRLRLRSIAIQ
jgi:hypothetical protein